MSARITLGSIGRFVLILLCLAIVLLLAVVILPIYLDISLFKGSVEEILTVFAEAPVNVERVELRVSPWPTLRLHGVSVLGSGSAEAPTFARVELADIRLSLLPLLKRRLEILELAATRLDFDVRRTEGRPGNWPVWTLFTYEIVSLENIDFQDIEIEVDDQESGLDLIVRLEQLQGAVTSTESLHLATQGTLEDLPLFLTVSGPTLADLTASASEFPISAVLELSTLRIELDGTATQTPAGREFDLAVGSRAESLSFLNALTDIEAPDLGGFDLESQVSISGTVFTVSDLTGTVGNTSLRGLLTLSFPADRPHLEGRIATGQLDLSTWLDRETDENPEADSLLPFSALNEVDAQLEVSIAGLDGLGVEMGGISTVIQLESGLLDLPFDLRLAGIPIKGSLTADASVDTPTLAANVGAREVTLDQVRSLVELNEALDGSLGSLELEAEGAGSTIDEIAAGMTVRIRAETARLTVADETGEQPIDLLFETLDAVQKPQLPLQVTIRGRLFDNSFSLELETAPLEQLLSADSWPIDIVARGAGAELLLNGEFSLSDESSLLDMDITVAGDRIGDLSTWIGVSLQAGLPYRLRGHLSAHDTARFLQLDEVSVGRTQLAATFDWDAEDEAIPITATIEATSLAPGELQGLFDPVTKLDAQEDAIGFDLPILPSTVNFRDTDLDFSADRIDRDTVDLKQVHAELGFREGRLTRSPFSFRYGADDFSGEIALDLRGETPRLALSLSGKAEDLGEILQQEEIVKDQRATAKRLELKVDAEGSTLRRLIRTADISGSLEEVGWRLSIPEMDEELNLELHRVDISGPADQPIVVQAGGRIRSEPLELRLELRPGDDFEAGGDVPFQLDLNLAQTRIELSGEMMLPIDDPKLELDLLVTADRLDSLGPLLGHDLPPIGPYRLAGRLSMADSEYSLKNLDLLIGESDLNGEIHFYAMDPRPRFAAELSSQQIHVQDLLPPREPESDTNLSAIEENTGEQVESAPDEPTSIVDTLDSFDAEIKLRLGEIVTADGIINALTLDTKLEDRHLDFHLQRETPNSDTVDLVVQVEPLGSGIEATANTRWERLPYGALADIIDPGSKKGVWSVDLDLETRGESIDDLLANLSGHLDFTDYPEGFRATILDLWGGGLVQSLLPAFNLGAKSKLNCTVGRFTISDGLMTPDDLIVDTTRSRVRGKGSIDLRTAEMNLKLKPRPKKTSLINLATPVRVRGPISDPSVTFTTGGVTVTAFRLSLWIYTVWADILRRPLPADGNDICVDPPPR